MRFTEMIAAYSKKDRLKMLLRFIGRTDADCVWNCDDPADYFNCILSLYILRYGQKRRN